MSAPTALDGGAFATEMAWQVHTSSLTSPAVRAPRDRRSMAHIAQLARAHNDLCTQAVDSYEIAAGLESAGIGDRQARLLYGAASVFELAETMFRLVPRRPSDAGAPTDRWHRPLRRHLLRGLLYGLPGLLYAVAYGTLAPGIGPLLLLCATIAACGIGQGISVLGHLFISRGEHTAAHSLFRISLLTGGLILILLTALGSLSNPLLPAALLAGIQIEYLIAATVLLVLEADHLLLAVLTSGVIVAIAQLTGLTQALPSTAVLAMLAPCPLGAVAAAAWTLSHQPATTGRSLREVMAEARATIRPLSITYVAYGTANAGLVSFAVLDALTHSSGTSSGPIALMMLPLVASLGITEWLVHRLRSHATIALTETTSTTMFRHRARAALTRALLSYTAILTILATAVIAGHATPPESGAQFALSTASYTMLGLTFLLETVLLSLGRHLIALALAAGALVIDSALRFPLAAQPDVALEVMHLAVFTTLFLVLLPVTTVQYTSVGMHR